MTLLNLARTSPTTFTINPENFKIVGLNEFNDKKIQLNKKHNIDKQFLQYHFDEYEKHY